MKTTVKTSDEEIPAFQKGQWNVYAPEAIRRWGSEKFLQEVAPREPVVFAEFDFSEAESQAMDVLMKESQTETE